MKISPIINICQKLTFLGPKMGQPGSVFFSECPLGFIHPQEQNIRVQNHNILVKNSWYFLLFDTVDAYRCASANIGAWPSLIASHCALWIVYCIVDCIAVSSSAILQGGEFLAARRRSGAVTELCGCPHPPNLHHHHHRHRHHHQPPHHHKHHLNDNKSLMNSSALLI